MDSDSACIDSRPPADGFLFLQRPRPQRSGATRGAQDRGMLDTTADPAPRSGVAYRPLAPQRVLVVDDGRDAANMTFFLLRELGHHAAVAYDAKSALALARQYEPDVVLLDLVLPDADGCDLARQLRSEPALKRCRIFVMSAHGSAEDRLRTQRAGCDAHFLKPVGIDVLTSVLPDLCRAR
jgi:CheY-like chemotaxis protein